MNTADDTGCHRFLGCVFDGDNRLRMVFTAAVLVLCLLLIPHGSCWGAAPVISTPFFSSSFASCTMSLIGYDTRSLLVDGSIKKITLEFE